MRMQSGIAVALALTLGGCAGGQVSTPESAGQNEAQLRLLKPYLALGDSVPFGYNPVDAENDPYNLSAFVGYPEIIQLAPIPTANASCEGESTGSFINAAAPDNGCHGDWRASGKAMHVTYASASESQLQFALAYLAAHPNTATVSVQIGANDLLLLQNSCIAAHPTDPAAIEQCLVSGAPATIYQAAQNLGYILGAIRQSGYTGQLVVVTYYSMQYSDLTDVQLQSIYGLDQALVQVAQVPAFNASVAKGFSSFAAIAKVLGGGDSCKAGLLYKLADGTCDKHPSRFGQSVLALDVTGAVPASQIDLTASTPQF